MTLQEFFTEHPKAALGFSGGVDSSYLLWAAVNAGADIAPYYIQTAFQPAFDGLHLLYAARLQAYRGECISHLLRGQLKINIFF